MAKKRKTYSPAFKFQLVMEVLKGDRPSNEIARQNGIHPVTLAQWKQTFIQKGPELFAAGSTVKDFQDKIAKLERLLGQKEVEIALLKNFLRAN